MNATNIAYRKDAPLSLEQFTALYRASTLAERRPADRPEIMQQMMDNASVTITAWAGDDLVGISRTLTDFGYVAYLADLAVSASHQGLGIGKQLIAETRAALSPDCMIVLLSAPAANAFYPHIGFNHHARAWVLDGKESLG
ncbi:MAG: GNAT family N-acetyltransferase [Gammaproteobacteria bacterium]|nr:GNAT family N-acetyltransferase [Gammaproteobacteria bacterium]